MSAGCAWSTLWLDRPPTNVKLKVNDLYHLLPFGRSSFQGERANFTFSVSADFRPLFNWNTRQIFVYITAEYMTKYGTHNQVVVWDKILRTDIERFEGPEWDHVWEPTRMLDLDNIGCKYLLMEFLRLGLNTSYLFQCDTFALLYLANCQFQVQIFH